MRVSTFHRLVSVALIVPFLTSATLASAGQISPVSASTPQAPASQAAERDTLAAGMLDGELLAERKGTNGKVGLGLGIGILTGLIGTGIGYALTGADPMTAEAVQRNSNRSADYQLGF